jgi:hypothetical protein
VSEHRSQMLVELDVSGVEMRADTFICESTHVASPSIPIFNEGDKWIDVCSTSSTPGNDSIGHHWHGVLFISKREIWSNCQCEGEPCFLQERTGLRYAP